MHYALFTNTSICNIQQTSKKHEKNCHSLPFKISICQNGAYLYSISNSNIFSHKKSFYGISYCLACYFKSCSLEKAYNYPMWACNKKRFTHPHGDQNNKPKQGYGGRSIWRFLQLSGHEELIMETKSNVKSSHAFIFMRQPSVLPLFQQLKYVIAINVLQGPDFWKSF